MNMDALKDLLYRVADDELILAHRHSEWTGLGPVLEEDIAFSSIAQDKLGHAQALYQILHELGEADPDATAFMRDEASLRCSQLVELPNGEYDRSLVRHFLFDAAEYHRYGMFQSSSYEPLAKLARKVHGELKYHLYHGQTWVVQLGAQGDEESHRRMQAALDEMWPYALGMFEPGADEAALKADGVFAGEDELKRMWLDFVGATLGNAALRIPDHAEPVYGGRKGTHTEYLQPLLNEMTEVYRIDPSAEW
ncbi:MAG: phenylacetate-CoA oxygenase subunit PaaC ['Candidatus Kapabacteria' thiocyanatum]|uniref:Phenylacetate-CoA oxygenase subunit PaaI n=1 Tax=Candidatus Kapaibacterium thiocyanatum TaxID=1895771 RepID=A0A1M3L5U8_9BACT|nr:phenylacetate-CoA oxygenase subunit PaaC ['Candidatus Kapabacteria' thiocyanatum]OJX60923.1 MAG: phenylacetate-CoA oxygenase subunit PaaI ['Candidatus Kapabacteria' thiocyanatum]